MKLDFDKYRALSLMQNGGILTVTLDRPEHYNAVNQSLHDDLSTVFYDIAIDDTVDIVILTGAGKAFCAGGDMNWLKSQQPDPERFENTAMRAKRIAFSLLDLEKPIVAKVNGPAVGLGATLALFCDVIFMADDTVIADPHVSAGVVAGDGGAVIWPQLIGYARAKEYLMTGDPIPAEQAAAMGLINHAVPATELDARVDAFVERLCSGPMKAIKFTKTSINIGLKQLAHTIMDASVAYEMATSRSEDHFEAVDAFLEKRKPQFVGR